MIKYDMKKNKKEPNKKKRRKNLLVNVIILLATLLVIFISGEVITRVLFPQSVTPGYWPEENKAYVPELKRMMYCNVTNLTKSTAEFSYVINTNSEGFRDFHQVEKPEGVTRILNLGDSMAFGNTVNYEDTYPQKLEAKLNKNPKNKVEVINLGIGGFSTAEEYWTLKKYGLKDQPDIILIEFYINDFQGSLDYEKRNPSQNSFFRAFFSHSKFLNWLYWKIKITPLGNKMINSLGLNLDQQDEYEFEMLLLSKEGYTHPLVKESLVYTFGSLKKIKELSESIGAELIVFYLPADYQIDKEKLDKIKEMKKIKQNFEIDYVQKILAKFLEKNKIDFFDFTGDFRAEKEKQLYWTYDRHLTKEGYDFLAELLAEKLEKEIKTNSISKT